MVIHIFIDKILPFGTPYLQGLEKIQNGIDFRTNVLDFFSFDTEVEDVIVVKKDGTSISRNALLKPNKHTDKEIRKEHNIRKLLVAGSLKFT